MTRVDDHDRSAFEAAKRTARVYKDPWTTADLREYLSWRSLNICEWPGCVDPGAHLAHVFGKGSGGRRSADRPENVAWLCVHHHDVLDGRRLLRFDDTAPLILSMPDVTGPGGSPLCVWYCPRPATGERYAGRHLCAFHHDLVAVDSSAPATRRRTELGQALEQIVERQNRKMGLAE